MKKLLLSASALLLAMTANAQTFLNGADGFTESFGSTGTSCLKTFSNAGYQYADGNIKSATNDANAITVTCESSANLKTGVALGLFDIYYTDGANCNPMRSASNDVAIDMSAAANSKVIIKAKADKEAKVFFGLATSAAGAYPSATTASISVPTANTLLTIGTTEQEYTIDFTSTEWSGAAWKNHINLWGLSFDGTVAANADAVVTITSIKFGSAANPTSTSSVNISNQVAVYPNPTTDVVNVDLSSLNGATSVVKLMASTGAVVSEVSTSDATASFNVADLTSGLYMVQITSDNKVATKTIVIE